MTASLWFDDIPVLGDLAASQAIEKLREIGEESAANSLEESLETEANAFASPEPGRINRRIWQWPFQDRPWQHTAHALGYLAPADPSSSPRPIQHAGNILAQASLKNSRIKITLDRLRVAAYPGGGTHRVLFDFYAQNQLMEDIEHLHFNATYRARQGEQVAVVGLPIFVGLSVGTEGVVFKCFTVNVRNDDDEAFLDVLESDVFKTGLKLATSVQPAIAPFSQLALGITRSIAKRHRNVPVQDFYMGLDFSNITTRARLAEGSYIAVQIPETLQAVWDWKDWMYQPTNGQIVSGTGPGKLIPYNYFVFSVSQYQEP